MNMDSFTDDILIDSLLNPTEPDNNIIIFYYRSCKVANVSCKSWSDLPLSARSYWYAALSAFMSFIETGATTFKMEALKLTNQAINSSRV